jgi:nitrite reductase (NADH) small subunit
LKLASPHPDALAAHGQSEAETSQHWTRICDVDEIPRLGARVVRQSPGPDVAIFRTGDDKLFALADRCPHRGGPLSQGIVFGERVACPLHNTCVELETGCAVAPDKGRVQSFAVKVDGGAVYVELELQTAHQRVESPLSPRERGRG